MTKNILLAIFTLSLSGLACSASLPATPTPQPTATAPASATPTLSVPSATALIPSPTATLALPAPSSTSPVPAADFCTDPAVAALLQSFKSAILGADGTQFAALVSPTHGLDVRFFRYASPVNYDREHAEFVFETTFEINWGPQPGSGEDLIGSFHDVIIPSLQDVFSAASTDNFCNQIKTGGATYEPQWPYPGVSFYSTFFPGTDANGSLDWQTWLVGVHYVQGQPYLYALIHLDWEP